MSRLFGILSVVLVVLLAMGFAAANAGHRTTLDLGLFTLYQIPVALVAFSGLFVGMLVMFATGIHTDLKVRRILRDRLAQEAEREQTWIDRNQKDLFADDPGRDEEKAQNPGPPAAPWGEGLASREGAAVVDVQEGTADGHEMAANKEAGPGSAEEHGREADDLP